MLILIDCLNVSPVFKDMKFVSDSFKFLSNISINKIIEIKKYRPPIHCVDDLHKIKLSFKCLRLLNILNPVEVNPDTDSK